MTAAIFRSTPSLSVPQTQNTAPVLEFACLYTHDLRKKTKRWNDGILRYHTFNKRAMVYDVPRNFIGDMHWTGEDDIQEGDEVVLEKAGVRVEVAERVGETETDLSELRAKKAVGPNAEPKKRVERADFGRAAPSVARASSATTARGNTQLKHKSLNALLGTPKGPIGKAKLPTRSPYEERYGDVENEQWEDGRPAKKARVAETRTKQDAMPLWARTADRNANQQQPGSKVFIDLSDEAAPSNEFLPGFSSDALAPSSPVRAAARGVSGSSSSPAFQTRQSAAGPGPEAERQRPLVPRMQDPEDDDHQDRAVEPDRRLSKSRKSPEPERQRSPSRPSSVKPGQTLRLAASAPKKRTLLCQDQLNKRPPRISPKISKAFAEEPVLAVENHDRPKTAKERVQARLDMIERKKRNKNALEPNSTTASKAMPNVDKENDRTSVPASNKARSSREMFGAYEQGGGKTGRAVGEKPMENAVMCSGTSLNASHESFGSGIRTTSEDFGRRSSHEASAIELARLDRMMLPPAAARRAPTPPVPIPSPREVRPLRRVISEPPNRPAAKSTFANQPKAVSRRVPGAPVRYTPTPSPTKQSREPTPVPAVEKDVRPPFKNKPKKNLQKSVSLNMTAAGTSTVILGRPFQAPGKPQPTKAKKPEPPPEDGGPWSREAFDLFKWRPPGWDEENWCIAESTEGENTTVAPAGLSGGASLPSFLKEKNP